MSDHTLDFIREALVGLNTQAEQRNQIEAAKLAEMHTQSVVMIAQLAKDHLVLRETELEALKGLVGAEEQSSCLTALALKENMPEDSPND